MIEPEKSILSIDRTTLSSSLSLIVSVVDSQTHFRLKKNKKKKGQISRSMRSWGVKCYMNLGIMQREGSSTDFSKQCKCKQSSCFHKRKFEVQEH